MTKSSNTFEAKIKDTFIKYGRVPFLVVLAIVSIIFLTYYGYSRVYRLENNKYTLNKNINYSFQQLETANIHESDNVFLTLYNLRSEVAEDLNVIIFDEKKELEIITQPSLEGSDYLRTFNKILLSQVEEGEWKVSVFTPINTQESYLVYSGKKDNKYIIYYMSNLNKLNFLKRNTLHLAITDSYDNVFYASDEIFINRSHKLDESLTEHYSYKHRSLDHGLSVHFFFKNNVYILILTLVSLALLLTYYFMQRLNKVSAKKIGTDFSHSIKQLHEAVKEMEAGNINTRVDIDTDDEFNDLGEAFNIMNERLSELISRNERLIMLRKDAEIKQLEAQFNPHFLYNTLETIKYLVHDDPDLASDLILETTMLLRYSIDNTDQSVIFEDDLEYIKRYLRIHKMRLGERFNYRMDLDESVLKLSLPKLLIQPLIENSLKHGFQNQMNLFLEITAYTMEDDLYIYVIDDGGGMKTKKVKELNMYEYQQDNTQGYGIKSVIQRLKITYGDAATFKIYSDDKNTVIEIIIKGVV